MYKQFYTLYINIKYCLYNIFEFFTFRTKPKFEILDDDFDIDIDIDIENDENSMIEIKFTEIRV